jgi:L-alanine-DL-glutamate epimerase-like enolase superfamily enzyme
MVFYPRIDRPVSDTRTGDVPGMSATTIEEIETIIVDLPLKRTQRFAAVGADSTAVVLVRIRSNEGMKGSANAARHQVRGGRGRALKRSRS